MNPKLARILIATALLAVTACSKAPVLTPTATAEPTHTPAPTVTPAPPAFRPAPSTITVCADGCDFVTIQAAIDDPGTNTGDVITVTEPIHTEAGITVHKNVVIQGLGAGRTLVQAHPVAGQATDRVFLVSEEASATIQGLTIRHGHPITYPQSGGGVANYGRLSLERCMVRDNSANDGGGIFNHGVLTVINCTISGNTTEELAPPGYECASGGGIKNRFQATLALENCTISGNHALNKGGGLFVACEGRVTLTNCTISGNQAGGVGGGLFIKGALEMLHCTITGNRGSGPDVGIYVRSKLDFTNCIVAGNAGGDIFLGGPGGYKGKGAIGTNVNNWVGDGSCPSQYSGDPILGPLADNGGDTFTHALLPNSPAIDLVPASACSLATDQRGEPRSAHGGSGAPECDVGAFEWQP